MILYENYELLFIRDTRLSLRYVEIGLALLYKTPLPTVETRALIRKLSNLREKICSWQDDSSVTEFEQDRLPGRFQIILFKLCLGP